MFIARDEQRNYKAEKHRYCVYFYEALQTSCFCLVLVASALLVAPRGMTGFLDHCHSH